MKNIKRSVLVLFAMSTMATGLWSFSTDKKIKDEEKKTENILESTQVNPPSAGELHNMALDYIYNNKIKKFTNESSAQKKKEIFDGGWEFFSKHYKGNKSFDANFDFKVYKDAFSSKNQYANVGNYSAKLKLRIDEVFNYIKSVPADENFGNTVFNKTRQLLKNPPKDLNREELLAWKSTVDVAGYSAKYWSANITLWGKGLIEGKGFFDWLKRAWEFVRDVVIEDAKGYGSGFVKGISNGKSGTLGDALSNGHTSGVISGASSSAREVVDQVF